MNRTITFRSRSFPPLENEDELLINEGTYGLALLRWLRGELSHHNVQVTEPVAEDFGWFAYLRFGKSSGGLSCLTTVVEGWQECQIGVDIRSSWLRRVFASQEAQAELAAVESTLRAVLKRHTDVHQLRIEKS